MLADLEFKNRDVDKVSDEELLEDRIRSLELRLTLHRLNVPPALQKRIRFDRPSSDILSTCTGPFVSKPGLECPVCLGRSDHHHERARMYQYARKGTLQKHFGTHKLPSTFPKGRSCDCLVAKMFYIRFRSINSTWLKYTRLHCSCNKITNLVYRLA